MLISEQTLKGIIMGAIIGISSYWCGCNDNSNSNNSPNTLDKSDNGLLDSGESGKGLIPDAGLSQVDAHSDVEDLSSIQWSACDTSVWPVAEGYPPPGGEVECAIIAVPVDHGNPSGKTMNIRIARQKSKSFPTGKALFSLAGGPGGSAVWESGFNSTLFPKLVASFDLVYVDQRGTGASDYMNCASADPVTGQPYQSDKEMYEACANAFNHKELNHYLTLDAAQDLEWVRKLLGYEKIYLLGVSYGTALGLEYIRQYPDHVATAVLDGLFPRHIDSFSYNIKRTGMGLSWLIDECKNDTECLKVSPQLSDDLENRRQQLHDHPRPFTVKYSNGMEETWTEDDMAFGNILDNFLSIATFRAYIPRAVHQAVSGKNDLWNMLMSSLIGGTVKDQISTTSFLSKMPSINKPVNIPRRDFYANDISWMAYGIFATVLCAEWFPNAAGLAALTDIRNNDVWAQGNDLGLAKACATWKVTPTSASLRSPIKSNVKVLLTSGDIDLNTPKAWGEEVAKDWPNATHLIIPHTTHPSIMQGYSEQHPQGCVAQIMESYLLADGDMAQVDTSCIQQISKPQW